MVMTKKQVRRNESTGGIDTNKFIHILLTIYLKKWMIYTSLIRSFNVLVY